MSNLLKRWLLLVVGVCIDLSLGEHEVLRQLKQYIHDEEYTQNGRNELDLGNNKAKLAKERYEMSYHFTDESIPEKPLRGYEVDGVDLANTATGDNVVVLKDVHEIHDMKDMFSDRQQKDQQPSNDGDADKKRLYKRQIIDANWTDQWQYSQVPSMYIEEAWNNHYNGTGITIAIVDDGIDYNHDDLIPNLNTAISYDILNDNNVADHQTGSDGHGTKCAGIAAAVDNDLCIRGAAFGASLVSYRIFGERLPSTEEQAVALIFGLNDVDIYSNSWGPEDNGFSFFELDALLAAALNMGVQQGRDGRGLIYVWSSGDGGQSYDDCNADGFSKSRYTISVGSVSFYKTQAFYSEKCAAILASTYSGDIMNKITTTVRGNSCAANFSGSVVSAPTAAGFIALMLQANGNLTWRDVQHIIVETSSLENLDVDVVVQTNSVGRQFNEYLGFGLMNASAMVEKATEWLTVPEYITCIPNDTIIIDIFSFHETINTTMELKEDCQIRFLEWVKLDILYSGYYRGDMEFDLVSPLGTNSTIFHERYYDTANLTDATKTKFTSVHYWGENPIGNWTLFARDVSEFEDTYIYIYSYRLTFYGTVTNPLEGKPEAGTEGGSCNGTSDCTEGYGCLIDVNICVVCTGDYRVHHGFCVEDGQFNGYCDDDIIFCEYDVTDHCVNNTCVLKPLDGSLGGRCSDLIPCDDNVTMECVLDVCTLRPEEEDDVPVVGSPQQAGSSSSSSGGIGTPVIAGAVAGGVVGLVLISLLVYFVHQRLNKPRSKIHATSEDAVSPGFDFSID